MALNPETMRFSIPSLRIAEKRARPVKEVLPLSLPGYLTTLTTKRRRIHLSSLRRPAPTLAIPICEDSHRLWFSKNKHLDKIVSRCKEVIDICLLALNKSDVPECDIVKNLIGDLGKVSSKTELPLTIIALMGGTGTGKSTLMNALLDRNCILPTSDDRACTSVVVEVVTNLDKDSFEADVEFLQENDWFSELQILLENLTSDGGSLRVRPPESGSDMYMSYCKVKAVYGKIDTFDCLSNIESVNQWLGKTHHLTCSANERERFQDEVEQFIKTKENGTKTQSLWPIIKHVRIKMPSSDVCSSGASLVDLPGIGDSNPARNKIAKEYLKECHSVWMVNALPRAIDDVTSRDLVDQELRRQFLMDGKMESIAFVCTMSDRFSEHNTIRTHHLDSLCHDLNLQKCSMEMDKRHLEKEIKDFQDTDTSKAKARIWELHTDITKTNYAISKICAESRNKVCVRHIRQLFRNIKMQSNVISDHPNIEDSETDVVTESEDSEEEESEKQERENNTRVFCCSSTEYQKIMAFDPRDGPPMVFEDREDTQIPALQEYVHELTYDRRQKGLEELVRRLGTCVFNFLSYIRNGGRLGTATNSSLESTIKEELSHFKEQIHPEIQTLRTNIGNLFHGKIRLLILQGVEHAKRDVHTICERWGGPMNKTEKHVDVSGLHWRSYRSTVRRKEVFTIPSCSTDVNLNQDLADPIYNEMETEWNRVFNSQLPQFLDKTLKRIAKKTRLFTERLCQQVEMFNIPKVQIKDAKLQLELSFKVKLKQDDAYTDDASQKGKASTESTIRCMNEEIDRLHHTMFDDTIAKLLGELDTLQEEILKVINAQCSDIEEDMRLAFEPLWKSLTPSVSALYEVVSTACEDVRQIYADASLINNEEIAPRVEMRPKMGLNPGESDQRLSSTISKFFKHIPEDQITVKRGLPQNDERTKTKSSRGPKAPEKETRSPWECRAQYTLQNGNAEEIMKFLTTCPEDQTSEVLLPFVNESEIQKKILIVITELLQKRLLDQGYEVSIWPGRIPYKSEHVLFCMYKTQKPDVGRYFNMDLVYVDIDYFGEMNVESLQ